MTDTATQRQAQALAAIKPAVGSVRGGRGQHRPVRRATTARSCRRPIGRSNWATPHPTQPPSSVYSSSIRLGRGGGGAVDFTLPGEGVTNYLLSVHFDDAGEIDSISVES